MGIQGAAGELVGECSYDVEFLGENEAFEGLGWMPWLA